MDVGVGVDEGVVVGVKVNVWVIESTSNDAPASGIEVTAMLPETSNRNVIINSELTHLAGCPGRFIKSWLPRVIFLLDIPNRSLPGADVRRYQTGQGFLLLYWCQVHLEGAM